MSSPLPPVSYYRFTFHDDTTILYKRTVDQETERSGYFAWDVRDRKWVVSGNAYGRITGAGGDPGIEDIAREEALKETGGVA